MIETLKDRFLNLVRRIDTVTANQMWSEIELAHSNKKRVYHNLSHLESLFAELTPIQNKISDWETVSFSIFYHDIVYDVKKKDNEEQSAILAAKRLTALNYNTEQIERCHAQIIATKSHSIADDNDTNLFTDADLSILGKDWNLYQDYFNAIRKEYKIYPNLLYKPARKKILKHFLEMPALYKTQYFKELYEQQARTNIERELNSF